MPHRRRPDLMLGQQGPDDSHTALSTHTAPSPGESGHASVAVGRPGPRPCGARAGGHAPDPPWALPPHSSPSATPHRPRGPPTPITCPAIRSDQVRGRCSRTHDGTVAPETQGPAGPIRRIDVGHKGDAGGVPGTTLPPGPRARAPCNWEAAAREGPGGRLTTHGQCCSSAMCGAGGPGVRTPSQIPRPPPPASGDHIRVNGRVKSHCYGRGRGGGPQANHWPGHPGAIYTAMPPGVACALAQRRRTSVRCQK